MTKRDQKKLNSKVYVLGDPSSTTPPTPPPADEKPTPPKQSKRQPYNTTPQQPFMGSNSQSQQQNTKKDYFSSRKITHIEEEPTDLEQDVDKYLSSPNHDDDTISIVTLSTSQYENKILNHNSRLNHYHNYQWMQVQLLQLMRNMN